MVRPAGRTQEEQSTILAHSRSQNLGGCSIRGWLARCDGPLTGWSFIGWTQPAAC